MAAGQEGKAYNFKLQALLCLLCTLIGAFYPTLLDWSKTASETTVSINDAGILESQERRAYPFSSISVVLVNDILQLSLACYGVRKRGGLENVFKDRGLVLKVMPLGFIYAAGELLTLRSVQKGSGPVYVVIANMKLVVSAFMSRAVFGRAWSLPCLHWIELVAISGLAAAYTLAEAGSSGAQWQWEGAGMALAKSSLVAFSSVFCESIYKNNAFMIVLTLQAFWGLVMILMVVAASLSGFLGEGMTAELRDASGSVSFFAGGPGYPLCASATHAACVAGLSQGSAAVCQCMSRRGWDMYTLLAVVADLSNAISSALVFKRLSAVAKYVCRAASAVPMYIFYCVMGRTSFHFGTLALVVALCAQVAIYTWQRNNAAEASASENKAMENKDAAWTQHYASKGKEAGKAV